MTQRLSRGEWRQFLGGPPWPPSSEVLCIELWVEKVQKACLPTSWKHCNIHSKQLITISRGFSIRNTNARSQHYRFNAAVQSVTRSRGRDESVSTGTGSRMRLPSEVK